MMVYCQSQGDTSGVATQRPAAENFRAELGRDQARKLLVELCVKVGFCLRPNEQDRIVSEPPLTVSDFTDAVFTSEGLDPAAADKTLLNDVRTVVATHFFRASRHLGEET
jgi:hypothetical protein